MNGKLRGKTEKSKDFVKNSVEKGERREEKEYYGIFRFKLIRRQEKIK